MEAPQPHQEDFFSKRLNKSWKIDKNRSRRALLQGELFSNVMFNRHTKNKSILSPLEFFTIFFNVRPPNTPIFDCLWLLPKLWLNIWFRQSDQSLFCGSWGPGHIREILKRKSRTLSIRWQKMKEKMKRFYHFKFFSTIIENKNENVKDEYEANRKRKLYKVKVMLNKVEKAFPLWTTLCIIYFFLKKMDPNVWELLHSVQSHCVNIRLVYTLFVQYSGKTRICSFMWQLRLLIRGMEIYNGGDGIGCQVWQPVFPLACRVVPSNTNRNARVHLVYKMIISIEQIVQFSWTNWAFSFNSWRTLIRLNFFHTTFNWGVVVAKRIDEHFSKELALLLSL